MRVDNRSLWIMKEDFFWSALGMLKLRQLRFSLFRYTCSRRAVGFILCVKTVVTWITLRNIKDTRNLKDFSRIPCGKTLLELRTTCTHLAGDDSVKALGIELTSTWFHVLWRKQMLAADLLLGIAQTKERLKSRRRDFDGHHSLYVLKLGRVQHLQVVQATYTNLPRTIVNSSWFR